LLDVVAGGSMGRRVRDDELEFFPQDSLHERVMLAKYESGAQLEIFEEGHEHMRHEGRCGVRDDSDREQELLSKIGGSKVVDQALRLLKHPTRVLKDPASLGAQFQG